MKLSAEQKTAVEYAGLASIGTALISVAMNQILSIELNFWMLATMLVVGIGVFIYIDIRK